jgi:hypothetical protein
LTSAKIIRTAISEGNTMHRIALVKVQDKPHNISVAPGDLNEYIDAR